MARARTNVDEISEDLLRDLSEVRLHLERYRELVPPEIDDAFAGVETFCAIALRVLAKTNPSKVRSEAVTVEISVRMAEIEREAKRLKSADSA